MGVIRTAMNLILLASLTSLTATGAQAMESPAWKSGDTPVWESGVIMGYTLGQNGQPWPRPWPEPLRNNNRGGFYVSQARLKATLPLDSTFAAVILGNLVSADLQEIYLE